jgi:hypothetical protein
VKGLEGGGVKVEQTVLELAVCCGGGGACQAHVIVSKKVKGALEVTSVVVHIVVKQRENDRERRGLSYR